jgi:hypothetical protein
MCVTQEVGVLTGVVQLGGMRMRVTVCAPKSIHFTTLAEIGADTVILDINRLENCL